MAGPSVGFETFTPGEPGRVVVGGGSERRISGAVTISIRLVWFSAAVENSKQWTIIGTFKSVVNQPSDRVQRVCTLGRGQASDRHLGGKQGSGARCIHRQVPLDALRMHVDKAAVTFEVVNSGALVKLETGSATLVAWFEPK